MFGNPPVPTLLLQFREEPPDNRTAYALNPNVFLIFQGDALGLNCTSPMSTPSLPTWADEPGAPLPSAPAKPWWKFW